MNQLQCMGSDKKLTIDPIPLCHFTCSNGVVPFRLQCNSPTRHFCLEVKVRVRVRVKVRVRVRIRA